LEEVELKEGFTWRVFLVILYASLVLGCLIVYGTYAIGTFFQGSIVYLTIILATEIARYAGKNLNRQEVFIIYSIVGSIVVSSPFFFFNMIINAYFRDSPIAAMYRDPKTGLSLTEAVPDWLAPPPEIHILEGRTLLRVEWLYPLMFIVLGFVLTMLAEISLGIFCSLLYVDVEKLPFPTSPIAAQSIITLAEREPERLRIFSVAAVVSFVYYFLLNLLPGIAVQVVGVGAFYVAPFLDLTYWLERIIPGATFAISYGLLQYAIGFLLPLPVVINMFIGSIAISILGNALALKLPYPEFREFQQEWAPTMSSYLLMARANLWIWIPFFLGAGVGASIAVMIARYRSFVKTFQSLRKGSEELGGISLAMFLGMFLICSSLSVLVTHLLIPDFPVLFLIFGSIVFPFIRAIISSRAVAETGSAFTIPPPQMRQLIIVGSGYKGIDAWFAPMYLGGGQFATASSFTLLYKVSYLTNTKPWSYIKAYLISVPLVVFSSLIFTELLWKMAPIPSAIYPATINVFPTGVIQRSFMVTQAPRIFKPTLIIAGVAIMTPLTLLSFVIRNPYFNAIALLSGLQLHPSVTFAYLIGSILGKLIAKQYGRDWIRYRSIIVAGMTCGAGLSISFLSALSLLNSAVWPKPY